MTSQIATMQSNVIVDQPELAVRSERRGDIMSGWAVAATLLVVLAIF